MNRKTAIYMWNLHGLNIAIPKKRGSGFLKVPYGHHAISDLDDIFTEEDYEADISHSLDVEGLDGFLSINYGPLWSEPAKNSIIERIMPKLAAYYGFELWEEDVDAFWEIVQKKTRIKTR